MRWAGGVPSAARQVCWVPHPLLFKGAGFDPAAWLADPTFKTHLVSLASLDLNLPHTPHTLVFHVRNVQPVARFQP
jgi:hypothetical protein